MRLARCLATLLAMLLAACQSHPPRLPEHADKAQRINTPFFPQQDYQCGPAALATLLGWSGLETTAEELVDEVWLPGKRGALVMEISAAARARGRLVYPVETPEHLFAALNHSQPVLVLQNLALQRWPRWHFAVVTGYRDNGRTVILRSDTRENLNLHWNRFVRTWARAGYQGWLILPPGDLPAQAEPLPLVQALQDLAQTGGADAADPFWRRAAERFPESFPVQFGHGNHLWQTEQHEAAISAFARATEIRPEDPAGWYNQVIALRAVGQPERARQVLARGLEHSTEPDKLRELETGQ